MLTIAILLGITGLTLLVVHMDYGENAFALFSIFEIIVVLAESWMIDFTVYPNMLAVVHLYFTFLGMLLVQLFFKSGVTESTGSNN
jgi:hypothetical protein